MQKKKEKDFYASQSPFLKDPPPPKVLYPFPLATMRGLPLSSGFDPLSQHPAEDPIHSFHSLQTTITYS